jgi:type IV pilus assembly protein PilC
MSLPPGVVYRNLAHLHGAGMAWPQALELAVGKGAPPAWTAACGALAAGATLPDALERLVPPIDVAVLRAGEASGRLEDALTGLAARHDEEERRERERKGEMAYPILVAHVAALVLPIPDLVAGRVGSAVLWALAVLVPLHTLLALQRAARRATARGDDLAERPLLRLVRGRAAVLEADARALGALGWMHEAGVPWTTSIPLAESSGAGGRAAHDLHDAEALVRAGRPLATAWRRVPPAIASGLVTGETSGRFGEACRHAAADLEGEARMRRARAAALMKPLLVLVLGAIVGLRVILFYSQMYSIVGL